MKTDLIKKWIDTNGPRGAERLAVEANMSLAGVFKVIRTGKCNLDTARRLSKVLGVTIDELSTEEVEKKKSKKAS